MAKYSTYAGVECTEEENKLIDSFKRLAKKWNSPTNRLWLFSGSGTLYVMMNEGEGNPNPKNLSTDRAPNQDNCVEIIDIYNEGGDWD